MLEMPQYRNTPFLATARTSIAGPAGCYRASRAGRWELRVYMRMAFRFAAAVLRVSIEHTALIVDNLGNPIAGHSAAAGTRGSCSRGTSQQQPGRVAAAAGARCSSGGALAARPGSSCYFLRRPVSSPTYRAPCCAPCCSSCCTCCCALTATDEEEVGVEEAVIEEVSFVYQMILHHGVHSM